MKKGLSFILLCGFIFCNQYPPALGAAIQAEVEGEKIEMASDGRNWSLGSEDHAGNRGVYEFRLPGETADNWSEMVTLNYFQNMQGPNLLDRFLGFIKGGLSVSCQKVNWKDFEKSAESVLYEWSVTDCPKVPNQSELARVVVGKKAMYVLHYASRKVPMPQENHATWYSLLNKVKILSPSDKKAA